MFDLLLLFLSLSLVVAGSMVVISAVRDEGGPVYVYSRFGQIGNATRLPLI